MSLVEHTALVFIYIIVFSIVYPSIPKQLFFMRLKKSTRFIL